MKNAQQRDDFALSKMLARFVDDESSQISLLAGVLYLLIFLFTIFTGAMSPWDEFKFSVRKLLMVAAATGASHALYYVFDVHKRWGFLQTSEAKAHFWFSMRTLWISMTWSVGKDFTFRVLGVLTPSPRLGNMLNWSTPEEYIFLRSSGPVQDILWGIVGFYMIDFLRYWVHRIGHYSFFYKTFPFAHHHHHNQMFMDVTVTFISPLIHLALWATYIPYVLLWSQGLENAVVVMDNIVQFSNLTQHLGFDPFPWLTRLNHKLCGVIPWVPLYHQYHHIPFVKSGNFGNTSVLFDYVYGTLIPESIYHIENGKMPEKVRYWVQHPRAEQIWTDLLKRKARLDLNDKWSDIFKLHIVG